MHGAVEVRLDTTSCNSYTLRPRQGLQDHHSGSPTRTRRRPKVAKSGIFTGLEAGLDGVPQVGVLDFEPDRYVGRPRIRVDHDAGLRGTCAGWAKVRLKPDITASSKQKSACHMCPEAGIDRQYTHNTPLQRHGSYGVHLCVTHCTESFFDAVPGLNRLAFIERVDSRGHR